MGAMAAWLACIIATLNEQLSCQLVTLNRKTSSAADRF